VQIKQVVFNSTFFCGNDFFKY